MNCGNMLYVCGKFGKPKVGIVMSRAPSSLNQSIQRLMQSIIHKLPRRMDAFQSCYQGAHKEGEVSAFNGKESTLFHEHKHKEVYEKGFQESQRYGWRFLDESRAHVLTDMRYHTHLIPSRRKASYHLLSFYGRGFSGITDLRYYQEMRERIVNGKFANTDMQWSRLTDLVESIGAYDLLHTLYRQRGVEDGDTCFFDALSCIQAEDNPTLGVRLLANCVESKKAYHEEVFPTRVPGLGSESSMTFRAEHDEGYIRCWSSNRQVTHVVGRTVETWLPFFEGQDFPLTCSYVGTAKKTCKKT